MEYIIDSNVILDIFLEDKAWFEWSASTIEKYASSNILVINHVIYTEISIGFSRIEDLEDKLSSQYFRKDNIPWEAAFLAGKCFMEYKKKGGTRTSTISDFYIGAHAAVSGMGLITRDVARYKTYFPGIKIIHPLIS